MSVIKHMMDKTAGLRSTSEIEPGQVKKSMGPVTAPGMMAQLTGAQTRIRDLEAKLADGGSRSRIGLDLLSPNPWQPRKKFKPEGLASLAISVEEQGVIQPIIVRLDPNKAGHYQIVAGERRFRVSKQLGLADIPARVVELTDEEMGLWALSENLNREDLSDFEVSRSIKAAQTAFSARSRLAESLGLSRAQLYRYLAYDELPAYILAYLDEEPNLLTVTYVAQVVQIIKEGSLSDEVLKDVWEDFFKRRCSQDELVRSLRRRAHPAPRSGGVGEPPLQLLSKSGTKVGRIHDNGKVLTVSIKMTALSRDRQEKLKKFVEGLLR